MNFLEQLNQQYGPQISQQLSSRFGLDPGQTEGILGKVAPYVLGGLHSQMEHPEDEAGAQRVLESHADESALEDIDGHFGRAESGAGGAEGILSGLLGNHAPAATNATAGKLGISSDMMSKILPMLIPIILGAVMQKMKGGGQHSQQSGGQGGGGMDILGGILGQSGGSNVLGDLAGMVLGGGGIGGQHAQQGPQSGGSDMAQKAGCLASLLGGLLKRK